MPEYREVKVLPYSAEQMCSLVNDVKKYPEFLPWCAGARVYNHVGDRQFDADLIIGFKMFRERYTSRVVNNSPEGVMVDYLRGPLKKLYNHWHFKALSEATCEVDFHVDFEFKSRTLNKMIGPMFTKASRKMVAAFEDRAIELYGPK